MGIYCANENCEKMVMRYSRFIQSVTVWNLRDDYYKTLGLWLVRHLHFPDVAVIGLLDEGLIDFLTTIGPMCRGIKLDVDLTLDKCPLDLKITGNVVRLSVTTSLPFIDWAPCLLKDIDPITLEILDFSCTAVQAEELQHAFHKFTRLKSLRLTCMVKNDDGITWTPSTVRTLSIHPTHHQMRGAVQAAKNGANVKSLTINQALHTGFGEPYGLYRGYNFSSVIRLTVRDTTPETIKLLQTFTNLQSLDFQDTDHLDVNKVLQNNAHSLKSLVIRNTTPSTNFNCLQQLNFLLVDTLIPPPSPSTIAYVMNKPPALLHHPSLHLVCTCATSIIDNEGHSHLTHPQGTRLYQISNPDYL